MKYNVLRKFLVTLTVAGVATAVPLGTLAVNSASDTSILADAFATTEDPSEEDPDAEEDLNEDEKTSEEETDAAAEENNNESAETLSGEEKANEPAQTPSNEGSESAPEAESADEEESPENTDENLPGDPAAPSDEEAENQEEDSRNPASDTTEEHALQAKNADGSLVNLSDGMTQRVNENSAEIRDEWLYDKTTGAVLDPQTGEEITKPEELTSDQTDNSAEEPADVNDETAASSETDAVPENPNEDTDAAENETDAAAEETETAPEEAAVPAETLQEEVAAWIARGMVVPSPVIVEDFRFWTVAQDPAFASNDLAILEAKNTSARTVGTLAKDGLCYVLSDEGNGWLYVESGSVRGFIKDTDVTRGEEASDQIQALEEEAARLSESADESCSVEDAALMAEEVIAPAENEAFSYKRITVYQTVVDKDYAIAGTDLDIVESASDDARVVGSLKKGALCYIIADKDADWIYVESGDVRGFIKNPDAGHDEIGYDINENMFAANAADKDTEKEDGLLTDEAAAAIVEEKGEESFSLAVEKLDPKENKALYYTMTSIKSGVPYSLQRTALVEYAQQFIGNPYIWGGTSLVSGADCSGFVQSIFAQYGYSLPRTSAEQSQIGKKIPVESAEPGDLIFYANGMNVYHVVIYAGDGKTVEAQSTKTGIVSGTVNYSKAVWAVQLIDDESAFAYDIPSGLGSVHSYMGWQKVTMKGSQQYALRESAGMAFDPEGFAVIDNRYVIACTTTFGNIGDYIDFYQEDGTKIPCIIGDFKNQNDSGCNEWGHLNGKCIIEFVVDQISWYGNNHANPGTASCHPEWHQNLVRAERVGSYYDK